MVTWLHVYTLLTSRKPTTQHQTRAGCEDIHFTYTFYTYTLHTPYTYTLHIRFTHTLYIHVTYIFHVFYIWIRFISVFFVFWWYHTTFGEIIDFWGVSVRLTAFLWLDVTVFWLYFTVCWYLYVVE